MHSVSRELTLQDLAALFEGRTRFVERLAGRLAVGGGAAAAGATTGAARPDPFAEARTLLRELPESEQLEALNAHPAIGAPRMSPISAREQGSGDDPHVLAELDRLNHAYEEKFGFRFVVFVNRREKAEILGVLRRRISRTREEELTTALDEFVSIAEDRYRRRVEERPTAG